MRIQKTFFAVILAALSFQGYAISLFGQIPTLQTALIVCTPPPSGMISWWDGDAVSGTTVLDIQGSNHGVLVNGATTATGKVGQAFSFDGVNDYIEVADSPTSGLDGMTNITMDAWIKPNVISGVAGKAIVNKYNTTVTPYRVSYALIILNGEVRAVFYTDGNNRVVGDTVGAGIIANQWYHVAATYDGAAVQIYVNGVPQSLNTSLSMGTFTGVADTPEPVRIGALLSITYGLDAIFGGIIDEVEIFNRALSAAEIQAIYNAGTAGKCKTPADAMPPTGTVSIDGGSVLTSTANVALSLTCDDGTGSGCDQMQFSNDGVTFSTLQPFAATASWTLAASDGVKTVHARFTDVAGNVSTAAISDSITLDTTPPAAPAITTPAGGAVSQSLALVISGTAEPNATIGVKDGAASIGLVSADGLGNWSLSLTLTEGVHSFTASATDGAGNAGPASAAVHYTADATAPVVIAPANINVTATGALTPVSLGTATATDLVVGTLTPTPSAIGPFSRGLHLIIWLATDTAGNTGTATQTVTVTNSLPVANADTATTAEDTLISIAVLSNDTDVEGDTLTVIGTTAPASGAVVVNLDNTLTYTPNANFNGTDVFAYTISDGFDTATATVSVTVTAVNDPPVAVSDTATTYEDVPVTIAVLSNDTDVDGDVLTVTAASVPANGSVLINPDQTLTYTSNLDFNGVDAFTYTLSDGKGGTATAVVNLVINPVNDAPSAKAVATTATTLPLGGTFMLDGTGSSDVDGDPIVSYTWAIFSAPAGSTAMLVGAGTATPSFMPDKMGDYLIALTVSDGTLLSPVDTLTLTAAANLPPIASVVASPLTGLKPLPVNFNALASTDPEGGPLTFGWDFGDGATATGSVVNHTYTAAGTFTAVMTVTDNLGNLDMASKTILVTTPNLPPTLLPTATPSSGPLPLNVAFTAGATDPEAQPLSYSWSFGDGGTSTLVNPVHPYTTPGTFTATVTVSDGVNPPVSNSLTISAGSALTIHITQAKFDFGKKDEHKGKVTFIANFTFAGLPMASDLITVSIDGKNIFSAPFADFKQEDPGFYKIKLKDKKTKAQAFIDFNNGVLAVVRHKMDLSDIDNDNGVDVVISFGSATGTDHLTMKEKVKNRKDEDDEKEMSHKDES